MTQRVDEETPLLQAKKKKTPLPWFQFSLVLFLQLAEPLTSNVIYPFAPQLIRDIGITHGNESQVGYYVGMMQSLFFLTQAFTVLHWSRISDRLGRKPVILSGLFGLSLSMYCFGLSRTFTGLVLSRSLNGALNGNIGVIKSMMTELTDSTNIAQAYAYMPIAWSTGSTLGPIIGGFLSRPVEQFPEWFGQSEFHKKYPYFLACSVPATFTAVAWLVTFLFLKETVAKPTSIKDYFKSLIGLGGQKALPRSRKPSLAEVESNTAKRGPDALGEADNGHLSLPSSSSNGTSPTLSVSHSRSSTIVSSTENGGGQDKNKHLAKAATVEVVPASSNNGTAEEESEEEGRAEQPLSLRLLLTRDVVVAAGNYATLSLVDIAYRAIQPVFLSTPIELGGLGLRPSAIGNILSVFGVLNGVVQVFFFARIHDYWGPKKVFIFGIASALPLVILFPVINMFARFDIGVGFADGTYGRPGNVVADVLAGNEDKTSQLGVWVWVFVLVQIVFSIGPSLSYGAVFIFIAAASPNKASLGATNGLSQTTVSMMRAIGPAIATSLFSMTVEHGYLHGQLVYLVLLLIVAASVFCATLLPKSI